MNTNNLRREGVPNWIRPDLNLWDPIDKAVCCEGERIRVAAKFLPMHGPIGDRPRILAEMVDAGGAQALTVDERNEIDMVEISVQFALSQQQVGNERELSTAVNLATRAANLLSLAEDILIFQGDAGLQAVQVNNPELGKVNRVGFSGAGLLNAPGNPIPQDQTVQQIPFDNQLNSFGENTFRAVTAAIALLIAKGHTGPYAVVFPTAVFADAHRPLPNTMVTPASAIAALVTENGTQRFYGTATLPVQQGLVLSLGGKTVDRVVGVDVTTEYTQVDAARGQYFFRVFERFAVRPKIRTAFVVLNFGPNAANL